MKRILIPVDGSPENLETVRTAASYGPAAVSRIELLNVQPPLHRHISQWVAKRDRDAWRAERAEAALAPARRIVEAAGIACTTHVRVGTYNNAVRETARALGVRDIAGFAPEPFYKRFAFPAGIGVGIALMVLADE